MRSDKEAHRVNMLFDYENGNVAIESPIRSFTVLIPVERTSIAEDGPIMGLELDVDVV